MPTFDSPAQGIPAYQSYRHLQAADRPVAQQHPMDGFDPFGRPDFPRHDGIKLEAGPTLFQTHSRWLYLDFRPPYLQLRATSRLVLASWHRDLEGSAPELPLQIVPQLLSVGQHPVMLSSGQHMHVFRRRRQLIVEFKNVRLAIPAKDQLRLRHLAGSRGGPLQGTNPATTFLLVDRLLVALGGVAVLRAGPHFSPANSQRNAIEAKGQQRVQKQSPTIRLSGRPQPFGL